MKQRLFLVTLMTASKLAIAAPMMPCSNLATVPFGAGVKIESAKVVASTATLPEHCDVRGTIWPEVRFAVKLPAAWNNRFYMVGNGGLAGTIDHGAMQVALRKGFATTGTDTGHDNAKEPDGAFGRAGPDNPEAERKITDFAWQAVHETAVLAKRIIKTYYGEEPRYSYWAGCSQGGRQGLIEAQRFPADFDGYVVGAPALHLTGSHWIRIWNAQAQTGPGAISVDKLGLLASAVYKKCDAIDGLVDGVISDPRKCGFDPASDLPKCSEDADGPSCFTKAQTEALKKIYGGVKNAAGELLFPGQPLGSEAFAPASGGALKSGWADTIAGRSGVLTLTASYMKNFELDPPGGPSWDYRTFNFETDLARTSKFGAEFNATNPDLQPLRLRRGRIIHYHGWADPMANAQMSLDYYESVLQKMGAKETQEFYRLFLIPGMFHCGGGVGCDKVDWLTPIVDWVEKGVAPDQVVGARVVDGKTNRTRPVCSYPALAQYKGTGSIDAAENFVCVAPEKRTR